mmetsp:Transcript_31191/g.99446  ORF Transcript_31191/g.99446 Transcript_31191/m.99446 type:complete len:287 (+) Transcript_31191:266-1126(+)
MRALHTRRAGKRQRAPGGRWQLHCRHWRRPRPRRRRPPRLRVGRRASAWPQRPAQRRRLSQRAAGGNRRTRRGRRRRRRRLQPRRRWRSATRCWPRVSEPGRPMRRGCNSSWRCKQRSARRYGSASPTCSTPRATGSRGRSRRCCRRVSRSAKCGGESATSKRRVRRRRARRGQRSARCSGRGRSRPRLCCYETRSRRSGRLSRGRLSGRRSSPSCAPPCALLRGSCRSKRRCSSWRRSAWRPRGSVLALLSRRPSGGCGQRSGGRGQRSGEQRRRRGARSAVWRR